MISASSACLPTSADLSGANGIAFDGQGDMYVASLSVRAWSDSTSRRVSSPDRRSSLQAAYPAGLLLTRDDQLLVTSLGNNNPTDPIYPELFPGAVFKFDPADGSMIGGGPFLRGAKIFRQPPC